MLVVTELCWGIANAYKESLRNSDHGENDGDDGSPFATIIVIAILVIVVVIILKSNI